MLTHIAGPSFQTPLLPVPVDTDMFVADAGAVVRGRLGFAGRFTDPRKNIGLFLQAVAGLRSEGQDIGAVLMGDSPDETVRELVADLGLAAHVSFKPGLARIEMRDCMQSLDVFVLPSHQEGLCIAALEAMACGVPVVSTRCGGPEEFVIPGTTGSLVGPDPVEMGAAIARIVNDRELRSRMSRSAQQIVRDRYSNTRAEAVFAQALKAAFPQLVGERMLQEPALPSTTASASIG